MSKIDKANQAIGKLRVQMRQSVLDKMNESIWLDEDVEITREFSVISCEFAEVSC